MILQRASFDCLSLIAAVLIFVQLLGPSHGGEPVKTKVVQDDIAAAMLGAKPTMQFHGKDLKAFGDWKQSFGAKLNELLGDSTPPTKWETAIVEKTELEDYTRFELLLTAEGLPSLPVYLLVPKGTPPQGKWPAVLCVHGHGEFGHHAIVGRRDLPGVAENIERNNYDYGVQFVRRGYVVAAPCMIPFGPRVAREGRQLTLRSIRRRTRMERSRRV